jgi:hypothetical protein
MESYDDCSICFDENDDISEQETTICKHVFHKKCLDRWRLECPTTEPKCPLCNSLIGFFYVNNQITEFLNACKTGNIAVIRTLELFIFNISYEDYICGIQLAYNNRHLNVIRCLLEEFDRVKGQIYQRTMIYCINDDVSNLILIFQKYNIEVTNAFSFNNYLITHLAILFKSFEILKYVRNIITLGQYARSER